MQRILIADPSVKNTEYLVKELQNDFEVLCCQDGFALYGIMREFEPDLLLLDLKLPNVDGLTFLRDIRAAGNSIPVVVTSTCLQDYIIMQLCQLGVATVLQKPWSAEKMVSELRLVAETQLLEYEWSVDAELDYILFRLGFKASCARFIYTQHGVLEKYKRKDISLTKELYPTVARLVQGSATYVEKGIRDGIHKAREVGDPELWQYFFPALKPQKCPTNEEFLGRIAMALHNRERPRNQRVKSDEKVVNF